MIFRFKMHAFSLFLLTLLAYLLGSVSFAILMSRLFQLSDPRTYGSGNPGATNVLRSGRKIAAACTLLGDCLKGWLAVFIAGFFGTEWGVFWAGLAVFLGHLFPVFHQFKGGKGVATSLGILLALHPGLGLSALLIWLILFGVTRYSSLAAIVAALAAPILGVYWLGLTYHVLLCLIIALLLLYKHRSNLVRLYLGTESRFVKK